MLVVAVVAIVVVGPKDLPQMLRAFGKTMSGIRKMAGDFQKQFDEAIKDADLDDVKKLASGKSFAPLDDVRKSAQDFQKQVKEQLAAPVVKPADIAKAESLPEPAEPAAPAPTMVAKTAPKTVSKNAATIAEPAKAASPAIPKAKPVAKPAAAKPAPKKPAPKKPAAGKKA